MLGAFRCWKLCRSGRPRKASGPGLWSRWIGCVEMLEKKTWTNDANDMFLYFFEFLLGQSDTSSHFDALYCHVRICLHSPADVGCNKLSPSHFFAPSLSHRCTVFWVRHVREMYVKSFKDQTFQWSQEDAFYQRPILGIVLVWFRQNIWILFEQPVATQGRVASSMDGKHWQLASELGSRSRFLEVTRRGYVFKLPATTAFCNDPVLQFPPFLLPLSPSLAAKRQTSNMFSQELRMVDNLSEFELRHLALRRSWLVVFL